MVKNSELFRKIMMFSKELKISAFKAHGEGPRGHFPSGPEMQGGCHMPPPPFDGKPPFPPHGEGRPLFTPHGFGKGPGGPMGAGMGRERVLVILSEHPEGMRQKALAEEAGINASTASEMITKLEDTGYVIRTADASDKRATVLKLTDMGAARAEEIREEREAFMDDFFGKLTEDEKQTLSDLLDKLMGV